jgi:hypothetical protein
MKRRLVTIVFICMTVLSVNESPAQETSGYKVSRLSFNSQAFSDISPVLVSDGIIFCSDRRISGVFDRTSFDNRRLYNMYIVERKDTTDWRKPVEIRSERSGQFNNGPMCIAPDGKTVYFTSEIETGAPSKSRKFRNHSGIFTAELSGTELRSIKPFKYNNPGYDVGQPSISSDGKYLYFASDMPGGLGASDIYRCELVNGEWGAPVNLGSRINSPSIDNFPFIHSSGRLYFSSNRPGGRGGLDVYYSENSGGAWDDPIRMMEPVNSSSDDFAFTAGSDLREGYFSSNRRRSDDIYAFSIAIIRKATCDTLQENNYCYEFVEENAMKYDTIPFRYEWKFGDDSRATGRLVEHCYGKPGKYLVQLDAVNLVTNEVLEAEQPYISAPDEALAGQQVKFSADSTNLPGWNIDRYYWSFEDETIAEGKNVQKAYLRPGSYNIQLIITSKPGAGETAKEACVSKKIIIKRQP